MVYYQMNHFLLHQWFFSVLGLELSYVAVIQIQGVTFVIQLYIEKDEGEIRDSWPIIIMIVV